jgi:hypothetical protein
MSLAIAQIDNDISEDKKMRASANRVRKIRDLLN